MESHDLAIEVYEGTYARRPKGPCLTTINLPAGATAPAIGDLLTLSREGAGVADYRVTARTHLVRSDGNGIGSWLKMSMFVERT